MKRIRVTAYLVEVRRLHARSTENLELGRFDGAASLRTAVLKILQKMASYSKIPLYQKVFRVTLINRGNAGPITGTIEVGDYGTQSDIIDADSGKVSYTKKKSESMPDPFYFHLEIPEKGRRGILCLQSAGLSGAKSLLDTAISGQLQKTYPDFRLHIRNLTIADALADYLKKGTVEEIEVEKFEIPADIADRFGGEHKSYKGTFAYSVRPNKPFFKRPGLLAYAKGEKQLEDVFDFDDNGFDVVRTKIRVGGELKTINLTKPDSINTSFDITNDLTYGTDGRPTIKSLSREVGKIVTDTAKRGGISL